LKKAGVGPSGGRAYTVQTRRWTHPGRLAQRPHHSGHPSPCPPEGTPPTFSSREGSLCAAHIPPFPHGVGCSLETRPCSLPGAGASHLASLSPSSTNLPARLPTSRDSLVLTCLGVSQLAFSPGSSPFFRRHNTPERRTPPHPRAWAASATSSHGRPRQTQICAAA